MTDHPVLVWTTIVLAVIVAVSAAAPKILGPISEALSKWQDEKRQRSLDAADDYRESLARLRAEREEDRAEHERTRQVDRERFEATIREIRRDTDCRIARLERRMQVQGATITRIETWSRKAYELIIGAGLLIDPPPIDVLHDET